MRERANELAARIQREIGIGIERDHVADVPQLFDLADDGGKARIGGASQQPVELVELPALALPPHPAAFRRIPLAATMQEIEPPRAVLLVQPGDQLGRQIDQRTIRRERLRVGVGHIAQQRKSQVFVVIGEGAHLETVHELPDVRLRRQASKGRR